MKKNEVKVGGVYRAKVSDKIVDVCIERTNASGGWDAKNLSTGKAVRIKSAQRLRGPGGGAKAGAKTGGPKAPRTRAAKAKPDAAKDANGATVANAAGKDAKVAKGRAKKATRANRGGDGAKRMGVLDAAAIVLQAAGEPMRAVDMIKAMAEQGLWTSPGGKTPEATLYAAIIREIANKGAEARFRKAERGLFVFNG